MGEFADSIDFVFISVDGKRDTPAALRQYFEFRQLNDIHALTGDEASVLAMGEPFGLSVELNDEGASEGYLINHTSGAFLLDQAGRWIKRYQFGVPPRIDCGRPDSSAEPLGAEAQSCSIERGTCGAIDVTTS